jgi:carbon monoxide dehydrogenase subunit G
VGGQAVHVFRFAAPPELAYDYFCDIPAVFQLLPDILDVQTYGDDCYRLIVGASDGHGHTMAAVFDLAAIREPGQAIRVVPDESGPPISLPGIVFSGALAAEAVFFPEPNGTAVEYTVDIEMRIPVPAVLRLMPQHVLQNLGERAMQYKMTQMISGFTHGIIADFHAWLHGG